MAIIRCPQCNEDVSDKAKYCPHCNYQLNKYDEVEKLRNRFNGTSTNLRDINNPVAKKFNFLVMTMKIIGYFSAFISLITFISLGKFWFGLGIFISALGGVWLSTLIFEAIAEALNLLQEIRDK